MTPAGPTLIIADGDLPGLLACAAAYEANRGQAGPAGRAKAVSLVWTSHLAAEPGRALAARAQAEIYEHRLVEPAEPWMPHTKGAIPGPTAVLLNAAAAAAAQGIETVLWPAHTGEDVDLDRISAALDRADLVSRLASVDARALGLKPVRVHALYADFTDVQVAELALDMDLPLRACWWWDGADEQARRERERWGRALAKVGWVLPDPRGTRPTVEVNTGVPRRTAPGQPA